MKISSFLGFDRRPTFLPVGALLLASALGPGCKANVGDNVSASESADVSNTAFRGHFRQQTPLSDLPVGTLLEVDLDPFLFEHSAGQADGDCTLLYVASGENGAKTTEGGPWCTYKVRGTTMTFYFGDNVEFLPGEDGEAVYNFKLAGTGLQLQLVEQHNYANYPSATYFSPPNAFPSNAPWESFARLDEANAPSSSPSGYSNCSFVEHHNEYDYLSGNDRTWVECMCNGAHMGRCFMSGGTYGDDCLATVDAKCAAHKGGHIYCGAGQHIGWAGPLCPDVPNAGQGCSDTINSPAYGCYCFEDCYPDAR